MTKATKDVIGVEQKAILLLEDDEGLSRGICFALEKEGYRVWTANTITEAARLYREGQADLLLLDLNLPDGDGLDFCKEVRKTSNVPIIILTARDLETDEIIGFEMGADDYIVKPFSLSVLKVRIAAMLRRKYIEESNTKFKEELTSGRVRLCKDTMKVWLGNDEIELSNTEYKLLKYFLEHQGKVLLKEQILEAIWDKEAKFVEENTLPVNIRRLRLKLEVNPSEPKYLQTVHGIGYIWRDGVKE